MTAQISSHYEVAYVGAYILIECGELEAERRDRLAAYFDGHPMLLACAIEDEAGLVVFEVAAEDEAVAIVADLKQLMAPDSTFLVAPLSRKLDFYDPRKNAAPEAARARRDI